MKGIINSIETMGLLDGPGIRVVVFMQGCCLRCKFCHNPETWNKNSGKEVTVSEIVNLVERYKNYFGEDGGVTFSGGEPLLQADFIEQCIIQLKKLGINTCIDTAGFGYDYDNVLKLVDLVLYDIKQIDQCKYKELTGQDISQTEKFLKTCQNLNKRMWIRQVIIPSYNDSIEYMDSLAEYISKLNNIEKVELLPYRTIGVDKYRKLNISYPLDNVPDMDKDECNKLNKYLIKKINELKM